MMDEIPKAEALARCLDTGVPVNRVSLSSDAQGSLPLFDDEGRLSGLTVGKASSLLDAFQKAVKDCGVPAETAICAVSTTPAQRYALPGKGRLSPGYDGDLLVLDSELRLESLYSKGRPAVKEGVPVMKGNFE